MLLKVWCLSEQYNWYHLRETVLQVIDEKLETFLSEEIFLYLGFEELKLILTRPTLCIRSEKAVFDALGPNTIKLFAPQHCAYYFSLKTSLTFSLTIFDFVPSLCNTDLLS